MDTPSPTPPPARLPWLPELRALRRIYAAFFLILFGFLAVVSDFTHIQGYDVELFLELSPLTAVATLLTSATLYRGLAIALAVVVGTLFLGRFFCSWICPLGIVNHGLGVAFTAYRPAEAIRLNGYRASYRIKYYLLAALLIMAGGGVLQVGLLDPIALLTRGVDTALLPAWDYVVGGVYLDSPQFHGGATIAVITLAVVLANRWLPRFWCRVLCPLGALLGVFATLSLGRIRRDVDRCTGCNRCLHHCQGGCDPHAELRVSECHLCFNCIEACPEGALRYGLPAERSSVHKPLDVSRRRLLETVTVAAVLPPLLRSSQSAATTPHPQVIRPPGSLPEEQFLARCIKCAACMRVCPTNVLQPALLEGGIEGVWTPILVNRLGYCEHHCVLCGQVCPTAAIRPLTLEEKLGKKPYPRPVKLGTAFFDQGRCLPWAMHTPCIVCEEVCPTSPKAIWYRLVTVTDRAGKSKQLKQPYVDPALCIGCGICENQCPVTDQAAIRVTSVGESRSSDNQMMLGG